MPQTRREMTLPNPEPTLISLGTTGIPDRDGYLCCCALRPNGTIRYGIKTTENFAPGVLLRGSAFNVWTAIGAVDDIAASVRRAAGALPIWRVDPRPVSANVLLDADQFSGGGIFGGRARWYTGQSRHFSLPLSPAVPGRALPAGKFRAEDLAGLTEVVELGIDLVRHDRNGGHYYQYHGDNGTGRFECKYNGYQPPPLRLGRGTLLGLLLHSHHPFNQRRTVVPDDAASAKDLQVDNYWYVKIGSVLAVAERRDVAP